MSNQKAARLGLTLDVDVKVSAEWKELAGALAASAADFFLKGAGEAASSGVSGLIKFVSSLKANPSPGYRAWNLAVVSFAWALDQILPDSDRSAAINSIRKSVEKSRISAENDGIFLPLDFIERPTNFQLYINLRDDFLINAYDHLDDRSIKDLKYKIDSSFSVAVFEILSKRIDNFKPIVDALGIPGSVSAELSLSWTTYRSKLIYDFNVKPLFGQEDTNIALSQLYVPLRGFWPKENKEEDYYYTENNRELNSNVVILDEYICSWALGDDKEDWLRLIGGGPGSGKSTTLKSISSSLAESNSVRPLFIPLQNIDLHKDLRESINSFFVDSSDSAFTQPPLSRASVEDGAPLLLIFDGLDELVAPGEAAKDVVGTFANRLNSLVSALSGSGARTIKVVVSGRMPAFQAATRYLTPRPHGALEAYGFLPVEESGGDDDPLWKIDQRPTWWGQYARLTGQGAALPEAFSNERLSGITHEPLLCYLLVLAGFATEHWELAAENRNRIYAALIGSVYERGWGDGTSKRLGPGRTLSKPDFNKLMETIALAAWLGGDARVASEEKFEESIEITDAKQAWSSFCEDNGNDITNLAMNFYFKASEKNQRGFEFTHKSFGEYLAARALLYIAEDICEQVPKKPDYAMRDWFRATKTGGLTLEMLSFLRDEIRLRVSEAKSNSEIDKIVDLKSQFQALARKASVEGFPVSMTALHWRIMEVEHVSAECSLWSIINSCARALGEYGYKDKSIVKMNWIDESELSDILIRHSRFDTAGIINRCLSYVDADDQKFSNLKLNDVNLEMASLSNSLIISCTFISGSFFGANLEGCRIYDSRVEDIDFSKSKLDGTVFHASKIRQCNFMEITGDVITMSPMTLISSTSNIFGQLGSRLHLLVTSEASLERVSEGVQERLRILSNLNTVERHDLVED